MQGDEGLFNARTIKSTIHFNAPDHGTADPINNLPHGTARTRQGLLVYEEARCHLERIARALHEIAERMTEWPETPGELLVEVWPAAGLSVKRLPDEATVEFWQYRVTQGRVEVRGGHVTWEPWGASPRI